MKNLYNNSKTLQIAITLLLLFCSYNSFASWPTGGGGANDEKAVAIVTSSSGNTYTIGQFQGTATFGSFELNSTGLNDIYILKVNSSGAIVWAIKAGGASEDIPTTIEVDESDNVYIGGAFYGTSSFGGSDLSVTGSFSNGFVAKISADGEWRWVEKIGVNNRESSVTVIKSVEGNFDDIPPVEGSIYVSGFYRVKSRFGSLGDLNSVTSSNETSELFIARLEHDGDWQWVRDRGASSSNFDKTTAMEVDSTGRIYLFGSSGGTGDIFSEDFNSVGLNQIPSNWVAREPGSCKIGAWDHNIPGYPGKSLEFAGDYNWAQTYKINTSGMKSLSLSFDIIEGNGAFSEAPDVGDDMEIYYLDRFLNWVRLKTYYGGGSRTKGRATFNITNNAFHPDFRILYQKTFGFAPCYDYWHIDNIVIRATVQPQNFAIEINNTLGTDPSFSAATLIPKELQINDIVYDKPNDKLIISGTNLTNNTSYCGGTLPEGSFVASMNMSAAPAFTCSWVRHPQSATTSTGQGITLDQMGNIYQIGTFSGSMTYLNVDNQCQGNSLSNETITSFNAETDVFLTSFNTEGVACWLTGGGNYDDIDSYPSIIGELEIETGIDISTNGLSNLYITGDFQGSIIFGESDRFNGAGGNDIFVQTWGTNGRPFQIEAWPIGVDLNPPIGAYLDNVALMPDFFQNGEQVNAISEKLLYWAGPVQGNPGRLIPLQPFGELEVHWRISPDPSDTDRIVTTGQSNWPIQHCDGVTVSECYQVHSLGAPVEIEPASGDFLLFDLAFAGGNASIDNRVFNNSSSGFSTVIYIKGPTPDILQYPIEIEVIRSIPFTSVPLFEDNVPWIIGTKVEDAYHNEIARTGYVLNELAYYDGSGTSAAYNRGGRTGQIIPVNRIESSRPQDSGRELSIAWYHSNFRGVYWPDKAVRYDTQWPFDPDKIIIASQQGGEVLGQDPLDPLNYPSLSLYIQSNPMLPGFNPNDEHAIFAPSNTGTGLEAIFALRSDFGSRLNLDASASSDPYVLVKYYDENALEWKMRIFEVMATGAGYNNFQFTGFAATTVSPPYPVRLLPGCSESKAVGQAAGEQPPPPFFQDYKAQIWAKSAGSGELMYYYPLQPGFFYDLDNNDNQDDIDNNGEPDLDTTCVPWLARLSEEDGGTSNRNDPIKIRYDITWPTDIPQLTIGETLLEPKNGLPDIVHQAAIQVVYDDLYNSLSNPLPTDTLAQMIDPLSPRFVRLDIIPESIATELQTTGQELILGSSDGSIKLPAAILKRLSYDPLNDKLILTGLYDPSSAGEPLLVPNVLSKRDRVAMKK